MILSQVVPVSNYSALQLIIDEAVSSSNQQILLFLKLQKDCIF